MSWLGVYAPWREGMALVRRCLPTPIKRYLQNNTLFPWPKLKLVAAWNIYIYIFRFATHICCILPTLCLDPRAIARANRIAMPSWHIYESFIIRLVEEMSSIHIAPSFYRNPCRIFHRLSIDLGGTSRVLFYILSNFGHFKWWLIEGYRDIHKSLYLSKYVSISDHSEY
jgi:hypothetical protein